LDVIAGNHFSSFVNSHSSLYPFWYGIFQGNLKLSRALTGMGLINGTDWVQPWPKSALMEGGCNQNRQGQIDRFGPAANERFRLILPINAAHQHAEIGPVG
jgi:hypothetical protein